MFSSKKKNSLPSDTPPQDNVPSDNRGSETDAPQETTYPTERTGAEFSETPPLQSSGSYPTNPTTEHRYGSNIGTGVYDPNAENIAHPSYTISESDFKKTGPDSGHGIHARQYYGVESGSAPVGSTTYVRNPQPEVRRNVEPTMSKPRASETDMPTGRYERSNVPAETYPSGRVDEKADIMSASPPVEERRYESAAGEPRLHERDVQRERGMAQSAEREKSPKGKGKSRKSSFGALFHRGQRDAPSVDRDADTSNIGNRSGEYSEPGGERLPSPRSEQKRPTGTTQDPSRLAKDPEGGYGATAADTPSAPAGARVSNSYGPGNDTVTGTGMSGAGSGVRGAGPEAGTGYDTARTGASQVGSEVGNLQLEFLSPTQLSQSRRYEPDVKHELTQGKGKPGMMDKIVGKAEIAIGKATAKPGMLAKGEAKAVSIMGGVQAPY